MEKIRTGAKALLVKNADVYAPEPLGLQDILICGETIMQIAPQLNPDLPELAILDVKGAKVLPGLVDGHVHVTGGGGESGFSSRVKELDISQLIHAGVTTVIGVLGTDSITRDMPQLLAKVKALKEQGLSAWCLTGAYSIDSPTITGSVKKDVCFIEEILGVKLAINDHRCSMPTAEELIRLAADVRMAAITADKPGVIHMHTGKGKRGLKLIFEALEHSDVPIRHFRPTHCGGNWADALRFGAAGGYVDYSADVDPTKTAADILKAVDYMPFEHITLSSDAGGSLPIWNENKEMIGMDVGTPDTLLPVVRTLVEDYEMPLEKAICLITKNPADSLMLHKKGRLCPGADGDLIVVSEKLQVEAVIARGVQLL